MSRNLNGVLDEICEHGIVLIVDGMHRFISWTEIKEIV